MSRRDYLCSETDDFQDSFSGDLLLLLHSFRSFSLSSPFSGMEGKRNLQAVILSANKRKKQLRSEEGEMEAEKI